MNTILRGRCPNCNHDTLKKYSVNCQDGSSWDWYCCNGCRFSGDLVGAHACLWKSDPQTVADKLQIGSVPQVFLQQQRFLTFWQAASARYREARTPEISKLQHAWRLTAGREAALQLGTITTAEWHAAATGLPALPGRAGRAWLLSPLMDAPGHITGFMALGYDGNDLDSHWRDGKAGTGLGFMMSSMAGNDGLPYAPVVMQDIAEAVSLYSHHAKAFTSSLPLLVAGPRPRHNPNLGRPVFWHPRSNHSVLAAAAAQNAMASPIVCSEQGLATREPASVLREVQSRAVPWTTLVCHRLSRCNEQSAGELLQSLSLSKEATTILSATAPTALRERLGTALLPPTVAIVGGNTSVTERDCAWYVGDKLICDAAVRIYEMTAMPSKQTWFTGTVSFKGVAYPFHVAAQTIDKIGLLRWAYLFLRDEARAGLMSFTPSWNSRAIHIATQLHPPQHHIGVDRVGWDQARQQLVLPECSIGWNGEISPTRGGFSGLVPALGLNPTIELSLHNRKLLERPEGDTLAVWALALAVAAHVAAPAFHASPPPLLVHLNTLAVVSSSVASFLGCPRLNSKSTAESMIDEIMIGHQWPYMLLGQTFSGLLVSQRSERLICPVTAPLAWALGWQERYWYITGASLSGTAKQLDGTLKGMVPGILKHMLASRDAGSASLLELATAAAQTWFSAFSAKTSVIEKGAALIEMPGKVPAGRNFARLVAWLIHKGRLVMGRRGFGQASITYDDTGCQLGWPRVRSMLDHHVETAPRDYFTLAEACRRDGYLQHADDTTWSMSKEWHEMLVESAIKN